MPVLARVGAIGKIAVTKQGFPGPISIKRLGIAPSNPRPHSVQVFEITGATGFDGDVEGLVACPSAQARRKYVWDVQLPTITQLLSRPK
jgi:D-ribose pyranose/furanose isomerase RbsD